MSSSSDDDVLSSSDSADDEITCYVLDDIAHEYAHVYSHSEIIAVDGAGGWVGIITACASVHRGLRKKSDQ